MQLFDHIAGNYRFLRGIAPYSAGVVAHPGYELVRVTLHEPRSVDKGFALIDQHLASERRPPQALCAVELRLPAPLSFQGFIDFNSGYRTLLAERAILVGEQNPVARTNVAPVVAAPERPSLYAFTYTMPSDAAYSTFVVAGAGDLRDQAMLSPAAVVRPGETTLAALRAKIATVMQVMSERLAGLGMNWGNATAVGLYTAQNVQPLLAEMVLQPIGPAARYGLQWHFSHPPIADLVYEMDVRGVRRELRI
jgi:hypothetical protein